MEFLIARCRKTMGHCNVMVVLVLLNVHKNERKNLNKNVFDTLVLQNIRLYFFQIN